MPERPVHVLSAGHCRADQARIRALLTRHFKVEVDDAESRDEAERLLRGRSYALVLVNRVMDADGTEGLELVRRARNDDRLAGVPIMLVSDLETAQQQAEEAGAVRGFGKGALRAEGTVKLLAAYLPARDDVG